MIIKLNRPGDCYLDFADRLDNKGRLFFVYSSKLAEIQIWLSKEQSKELINHLQELIKDDR